MVLTIAPVLIGVIAPHSSIMLKAATKAIGESRWVWSNSGLPDSHGGRQLYVFVKKYNEGQTLAA